MSSLAGALDGYTHPHHAKMHYNHTSDDIEMTASKIDSEAQDDDEEMEDDLFGNDNDVEEQKHVRSVKKSRNWHSFYFIPLFRISRTPASPTTSGPDSERLPSPERERRQALEYEEEDAPPEISVEVKEAHVAFPNLPVPKSSDGNVSPSGHLNSVQLIFNRTGSSGCRTTSSWTLNHFILIRTLDQKMKMKRPLSLKTFARKVWVSNSKLRTQFVGVGPRTLLIEM